MNCRMFFAVLALACSACGQNSSSDQSNSATFAQNNMPEGPLPDAPAIKPGDGSDVRTPISVGAIDPKSAQGASQVIQQFAALIEQKRFAEASALGGEDFTAALDKKAEIHAEIGAPGSIDGAAGSLYVEIPVRFYGALGNGKPFSDRMTAILRRVNDVPGSTEQQRRWHIYRMDMQQGD